MAVSIIESIKSERDEVQFADKEEGHFPLLPSLSYVEKQLTTSAWTPNASEQV